MGNAALLLHNLDLKVGEKEESLFTKVVFPSSRYLIV